MKYIFLAIIWVGRVCVTLSLALLLISIFLVGLIPVWAVLNTVDAYYEVVKGEEYTYTGLLHIISRSWEGFVDGLKTGFKGWSR